jgi:nucleoside-diphosphate-sugar epimerase
MGETMTANETDGTMPGGQPDNVAQRALGAQARLAGERALGAQAGLAGQRVLVTGGAGVIGRETLIRLSALGAVVLSVDRLPLVGRVPDGVDHLVADLAFANLGPIERFRPRHVVHLAATFERSIESPEFWEQNWNDNVIVTHRLAESATRMGGLESFVFASSYLVYDPAQYSFADIPAAPTALAEDARLRPRNLCGAAKLYGEAELLFARDVQRAGFRSVFARIFRVYGRGSRDVVSRWVRAALAGERIDVYHAENRFDYVYSGDVAEGLIRMAATPGASGPINLATGKARPVSAVIETIQKATRRDLDVNPQTADEPFEASAADTRRLTAVLGWSPPIALEDGVRQLVAFERTGFRDDLSVAVDA